EQAPAPQDEAVADARAEHLFVLSAQTPAALTAQARRLADALGADPSLAPGPVAATLALGRSHFVERLATVAGSTGELQSQLRAFVDAAAADEAVLPPGLVRSRASLGAAPEVVFMFTGQGSQYLGMGRQLYE